jgi:hypothetical protein
MGDIFRGSACTIAALAARNSHEGCFRKRNPLFYRDCRILGTAEKGVYVSGGGTPKRWITGSQPEPRQLYRRAWVVQERLLSPRTLHFDQISIGWECIECEATETSPDEDSSFGNNDPTLRPKRGFASLGDSLTEGTAVDDGKFVHFHNAWWSIVETYTRCDLTFASDKLVAISGLINTIESRTGLTNIAGHWKEFLLQDILWAATYIYSTRTAHYRAPSWSWASMDCTVTNRSFGGVFATVVNSTNRLEYKLEWVARIVDADITRVFSGASWNGQVSGGFIQISARMRTAEWGQGDDCSWIRDDHLNSRSEVWCILIVRAHKPAQTTRVGARIIEKEAEYLDEGLVLVPKDEKQSQWERIGFFSQRHHERTTEMLFHPGQGEERLIMIT